MPDQLVFALTLVAMLLGLVGVVVPFVPGILVVGAAAIVSTFVFGISASGWLFVATVALITLGGAGASLALPARRGLRGDAARSSLGLAATLAVVGFFVIPVVGLPLGALVGLYLGEHQRHGDRQRAWASTLAVMKAYGLGVLVELGAALLIILLWLPGALSRL